MSLIFLTISFVVPLFAGIICPGNMPNEVKISFNKWMERQNSIKPVSKDFCGFNANEILPDYQIRKKAIWENIENAKFKPKNQVGMDKIRAKSLMGRYFVDFANSSTIHGLNHLAAPHRHPVEKILTVALILTALVGLITLSLTFWRRYQFDATITVLEHNYRFFTVTKPSRIACPIKKLDESKLTETLKKYDVADTLETREFFDFLANASYDNFEKTPDFDAVSPDLWLKILYEARNNIIVEKTTLETIWFMTDRGLCLSERNEVAIYSNPEYWFANNWTVVNYLYSSQPYTYETPPGIDLFNTNADMLFTVSDPKETINYKNTFYATTVYKLFVISLEVTEITSSDKLKDLSVQQRHCKFLTEGGLKMWPVYTYKMCVMECTYNKIRSLCGCYPHFARPMRGVPICNAKQLQCIGQNVKLIIDLSSEELQKCGCNFNCNNIEYESKLSTVSDLSNTNAPSAFVHIPLSYPKNKYYRDELYSFMDFLTSVGGTAGLFLGASVLSFVEIFFIFTLRLVIYYTMNRKNKSLKE